MNLSQAFRKAIESAGLENISKKSFWNIVKDLCPVENNSSFLWEIMVERGFIDNFLDLKDSEFEIEQFISRICYNIGLSYDKVMYILHEFRLGVLSAFYGINPRHNSSCSIRQIFSENREQWNIRTKELGDGIIIAKLDGKYGVLSLKGEILPFKYRGATKFSQGLGCYNDGINTGFINIMGNIEIDINQLGLDNISSIGPFENGIAKLHGHNHKIGYLSINGNKTECIYDDELNHSYGSLTIISKDGLKGLMNQECQIIVEPQFSQILSKEDSCFLLGKDTMQKWSIISYNGEILKTNFENPAIIDVDLIQDIRVFRSSVRYKYFNCKLRDLVDFSVDYATTKKFPFLIHANHGLYYFISSNGIINDAGYEKAFPFCSDYSWVKVGFLWFRINKEGEVIQNMDGIDVLSSEINGLILRRNLQTSLMEVYDSEHNTIIKEIPDSQNTLLKENRFTIGSTNYVWTYGRLISSEKPIMQKSRRSTYTLLICNENDAYYELIIKGKNYGLFHKINRDDTFQYIITMANGIEVICYKTNDGLEYMYNIILKTFSSNFKNVFFLQHLTEPKAIIVEIEDDCWALLDSSFNIVAQWDYIEPTRNLNYFRISSKNKYGLITYDGTILISPKYDSLVYFKSVMD